MKLFKKVGERLVVFTVIGAGSAGNAANMYCEELYSRDCKIGLPKAQEEPRIPFSPINNNLSVASSTATTTTSNTNFLNTIFSSTSGSIF